jgi:secondary thiamine-phosphate synthase enzyme
MSVEIVNHLLNVATDAGISCHDLTPQIRELLATSGVRQGFVVAASRHTTTALVINENEQRLLVDVQRFFARLVPAGDAYLHNDIHLRQCPPDEPQNAHSHLIAMLLGSSEALPVIDGELALGTWQSLLLVELDGPRTRTVTVQICGSIGGGVAPRQSS